LIRVPADLVETLKQHYPRRVQVVEVDEGYGNWFATDLHREIAASVAPGRDFA
jgi:hypothetical protein